MIGKRFNHGDIGGLVEGWAFSIPGRRDQQCKQRRKNRGKGSKKTLNYKINNQSSRLKKIEKEEGRQQEAKKRS
jgi:hypothetical protein